MLILSLVSILCFKISVYSVFFVSLVFSLLFFSFDWLPADCTCDWLPADCTCGYQSEQALDLVAFDPALWEDIADWGPQPASQSGKPTRASSAIRPRPSRSPSELDELSDTGSRSRSRSPPPGMEKHYII